MPSRISPVQERSKEVPPSPKKYFKEETNRKTLRRWDGRQAMLTIDEVK